MKAMFGDDAETLQAVSALIDKGQAGYNEVLGKMQAQAELRVRVDQQLLTLSNLWEAATGAFTNVMAGGCLCCGWPGIDWYKGRKRLALTSVQHGHGIRWKEFGTQYFGPLRGYGDIPLTNESAIWLIEWLGSHGITNNSDYSAQRLQKLKKSANKAIDSDER